MVSFVSENACPLSHEVSRTLILTQLVRTSALRTSNDIHFPVVAFFINTLKMNGKYILKDKAVPLYATRTLRKREGIALTHSRPRY
jgi:hypothetical protein